MSRTSLVRMLLGPVTGTAIALGAVSPPMHAAADASVAAHMIQHLVLILVAGLLLALGEPLRLVAETTPRRWWRAGARAVRRSRIRARHAVVMAICACVVHYAVVWVWHIPRLYEQALASRTVHALEHLSLLVTAYAFWSAVLGRRGLGPGGALVALFVAAGQGSALGALLTLAETPWYTARIGTDRLELVTALEDQQLAGLFMWIGGGLAYAGVALAMLARIVRDAEPRRERRGRCEHRRVPLPRRLCCWRRTCTEHHSR